jgi:hypothetical protein
VIGQRAQEALGCACAHGYRRLLFLKVRESQVERREDRTDGAPSGLAPAGFDRLQRRQGYVSAVRQVFLRRTRSFTMTLDVGR